MLLPDDRFGKNLPEPFFGSAPTALLQGFEMLGSDVIEVHIISCVIRELPAPEKLADNIWYHQIVLPKWTFLRSLHLGPILAVRRKLREIRPDLVHSQGTEMWCAITGCLSGYPAVLTIHGHLRLILKTTPMKPYAYWYLQMILGEIAIRLHNGVICISGYIEKKVNKTAKKTWFIPNAIRNKFFEKKILENTSQIKTILVVGIVCERKRTLELLELAKTIYTKRNDFQFLFVGSIHGENSYTTTFEKNIFEASNAGYASFVGNKNIDDLITLMDSSHALLHYPTEEAFGLVVAEALSRNLKIFVSSVGGITDIVKNINDAVVLESNNKNALEKSIIAWLDGGGKRVEYANEEMQRKYHPEVIAREHLCMYNNASIT